MRSIIFILLFCFSNIAHSQKDNRFNFTPKRYTHSLQFAVENGVIVSNGSQKSNQLIDRSYYNGLDVKFGWTKKDTDNTYNQVYRFPTLGLGWYSSTFHNSDVGKPNALYFYFVMPLHFEETRKWTGSYIGAFGFSYDFNPFDETINPSNILIGSYRNCYIHVGYNLNFNFNNKFAAYGSVGFKHFSNGAVKLPNKGINLIPFGLGVKYRFSDQSLPKPEVPLETFIRHNQWNVMMAAGYKNYELRGSSYFKSTLGFNYLRQMSYKYRVGLGMDFFYSDGAEIRNKSDESDFSKSVSYAVVGSWEWVINRIIYVPIGVGYYLQRNLENGEEEPYYGRIGMRFRISDHYNLGITIKAHGGHADYFEWTFAYTFHKDPNNYQ